MRSCIIFYRAPKLVIRDYGVWKLRVSPLSLSLSVCHFIMPCLFLSVLAKLEGVSALIGPLVGRLRSCGINSPARFTSLWLYSQCRNHARTDIPCCAAHSALLKHQKQPRSAKRGWRTRMVRIVDCLMLSREQSINVINAIIKTYKWHCYQRNMFTRGNNVARLNKNFLLTAFITRSRIENVQFLYILYLGKFNIL